MGENIAFEASGGGLEEGWRIIRGEAGDVRLAGDGLSVRVRPGSIYGPDNTAKNLLVRPLREEAAGCEVRAEMKLALPYEQAGLLWYYDDDNYVKLVLELLDGVPHLVLVREEGAAANLVAKAPAAGTEAVKLRIALANGVLAAGYRLPGESEWRTLGECPAFDRGPDGLHAGVFGHCGSDEEEHWASFSSFIVFH